MGLSENEKQVLEELERALYADDASFAKKSRTKLKGVGESPAANSPAKIVAGVLLATIGVSILVFAAISQVAAFGVAGFLVMLFGILIASATRKAPANSAKPASPKQKGSYFEDRWNKRSNQ